MTKGTVTTTRRAILAGAASLPALAIPAAAIAGPDPIFDAIERHRAAHRALKDKEGFDGSDEQLDNLIDAETGQLCALLECQPTTFAGLAALIRHVADHATQDAAGLYGVYLAGCDLRRFGDAFLPAIASQVEAMAVRS